MTRWKLTIEYKGSDYAGWQRQAGPRSVQQAIEEAITAFCGQHIVIHAAGRTDSGVHAWGQVAHFDLDYGTRGLSGFQLVKALNAHLYPQTICIVKAEQVADDFHARFGAVNKLYRYRIVNRGGASTIDAGLAWHIKHRLDVGAMRQAAAHLTGTHDFTSFRDSQCQAKSPIKTLERLEVIEQPYGQSNAREIIIEAEGRSFLHHQVRNMVGTLSLVGRGRWEPDDVVRALVARDRTQGGPTAPPDGLYLTRIDY